MSQFIRRSLALNTSNRERFINESLALLGGADREYFRELARRAVPVW